MSLCPGDIWLRSPYKRGRRTIYAALGIDPADPYAAYAASAFMIVETDQVWIGGAIGCFAALSAPAALAWSPEDVSDVILWNPKTGATQLLCEPTSTSTVVGSADSAEVTVYGDTGAYFRAWAERRAETLAGIQAARADKTRIVPAEPPCGGTPGLLVIGDINKIYWREIDATTLVAGPGMDRDALNRAVFRSARLPRVIAAATDMRHAA